MDEERMTILRMVAENKISAEEAAQLLDALKGAGPSETRRREHAADTAGRDREYEYNYEYDAEHPGRRRKRRGRRKEGAGKSFDWSHFSGMVGDLAGMAGDLTGMAQDVSGMVQGVFGADAPSGGVCPGRETEGTEQPFDIPEGTRVSIVTAGGHLSVRGTDGQMRIRPDGAGMPGFRVKRDEENKRVHIAGAGRDLTVELPGRAAALKTRVAGGNITLSGLPAAVTLRGAGGNVALKDITGAVTAHVVGGNIDMEDIGSNEIDVKTTGGSIAAAFRALIKGTVRLKSQSGSIKVKLPADSAFDLEATTRRGRITTNLPEAEAPARRGAFRTFSHTYNGGGATLSLTTRAGDITVHIADPAEETVSSPE